MYKQLLDGSKYYKHNNPAQVKALNLVDISKQSTVDGDAMGVLRVIP